MTGDELARSYLVKARVRCRVLDVLAEQDAWSDVVREAQELVELALKAALRLVGIDPPHWHDVGPLLAEHAEMFPPWFVEMTPEIAETSRWLRREREFAFYGDVDLIPTEAYREQDGRRAVSGALNALAAAERLAAERGASS